MWRQFAEVANMRLCKNGSACFTTLKRRSCGLNLTYLDGPTNIEGPEGPPHDQAERDGEDDNGAA